MTQPAIAEQPRHVHYCKDYADSSFKSPCLSRGYCQCKCGATAPIVPVNGKWEWKETTS